MPLSKTDLLSIAETLGIPSSKTENASAEDIRNLIRSHKPENDQDILAKNPATFILGGIVAAKGVVDKLFS